MHGQHSTTSLKTMMMGKRPGDLVSRIAGGAQWTWKKVTVVVDSGAAENVMPRSMFPEIGIRQTNRSKNGKAHQELRAVMTVRNSEGLSTRAHGRSRT